MSTQHTLEFRPHDVLFFRDGRPMSGSTHGDGCHFPHPHILHAALHAALHRAFPDPTSAGHTHRKIRRNRPKEYQTRQERVLNDQRTVRFGSLKSVGPFPAIRSNNQLSVAFPAPANLLIDRGSTDPQSLTPVVAANPKHLPGVSSLPEPLTMAPAPLLPPAKREPAKWISKAGLEAWLANSPSKSIPPDSLFNHQNFFDGESTIGIAIDPATGTTRESQFYSKTQMRLRPDALLVGFASMESHHHQNEDHHLLSQLFPQRGKIFLGGEQRICEVNLNQDAGISTMLPLGPAIAGRFIKWLLLSPAVFPWLPPSQQRTKPHPGGWLPNWIDPADFSVKLLDGPGKAKAERTGTKPGQPIGAKLVSAQIPRPIIITGWSSYGENRTEASDPDALGARSTLLAVPAGSIYYFEANDTAEALKLAAALNWHGANPASGEVANRRSTLFGEKGFGLGVCGPWQPLD